MIRPAQTYDIAPMLDMAARFAGASGTGLPFDRDHCEQSLRHHMIDARRLSLVADVDGTLVGLFLAAWELSPLSPVRLAQELVFWIEPGHRGGPHARDMIAAYLAWAREWGVWRAGLVALPDSRAGVLYRRAGFAAAETVFSIAPGGQA